MKLVIGGSFQGKKRYASTQYQVSEDQWADGSTCDMEKVFSAGAVDHFHEFIRNQMNLKKNLMEMTQEIIKRNPNLILVTDEVGYGIVPMKKEEREWREACGRVCTILASEADEVVRVCCGIGTKIK